MKRLIVVAAPSCCGKTTFVQQLRDGELQRIAEQLEMGDLNSWEYRDMFFANSTMISELGFAERVILHWTIPHPSLKLKIRNLLLGNAYDKKVRLTLIDMAKGKTFLTLVANPPKLIERVRLREIRVKELFAEGRDSLTKHKRKMRDISRLIETYGDMEKVIHMYERWFAFCEQMGVTQHHIVDVNASPRLTSINSWRNYVNGWSSVN